ncbi:MAG: SpoIIE family protein phosphatase [Cocleimonas sp.]|nr:SpoIIE family protein phosphatase [Cocleimonas sp.]
MKILVVDDARDMRIVIQHLLKKLGHDVDTAVDGEDGWAKLQENNYQVVVSDWVMPKADGIELCKRIRAAEFPQYIYFILLTGMSGKQNLMSGIEAGADDFATKPAEITELEIRLRSAQRVVDLETTLAQRNVALHEAHSRIQEDLVNAEKTQLSLLPEPLDTDYVKSAWLYKPAIYVGGDTFNYFSPASDILVFFSIDISGHGISSSMLSMSLQSSLAFKRGLYGTPPIQHDNIADMPALFAHNLNKMIVEYKTDHYLTMIFGIIDFKNKDVHYVQAGHPHPMWFDKKTESLQCLEVNGFPVGLWDGAEYESQHRKFSKGDKFIVYSDGISENKSALNNELLEADNLYEHFNEIKNGSVDEIIEKISSTWLTEDQMKALPDDLSILAFEFK